MAEISRTILISIKKQFSQKIFSGEKTWEFRKAWPHRDISKVIVYESGGTGKVVGEFVPGEVLALNKEELWERTQEGAGITKAFFDKYFGDRLVCRAMQVLSYKKYKEPKSLTDIGAKHPPQNYQYLHNFATNMGVLVGINDI